MPTEIHFTSISFANFKALKQYSVSLKDMNILVGANNCGKSTVISAFRILAAGLRRANARRPELVPSPAGRSFGYQLIDDELPVSLENVHTDYSDESSTIRFQLSNGNSLLLFFPISGGCSLLYEVSGRRPQTVSGFRAAFPVSVAAVPVLGPVEHNEPLIRVDTVNRHQYTHRASRHFRSYWFHNPDPFETFADLVRSTWPGMEILRPERASSLSDYLVMFCKEERIDRELYWAGFGFQVWCQMLTHISRSSSHSILVIDEPEIYLHPEVQRQLLSILRSTGPDVLIATHSTEIMSEADPAEILLVDKSLRSARRLREIEEVQAALDSIGSIQNITLTQLARNRKVFFVESRDDFKLIQRFAVKLGFIELAAGSDLTPVESEGASSWERIKDVAWGIERTLGGRLRIAALFDRDYRSVEECVAVTAQLSGHLVFSHILHRKEIENYLLVPTAIERSIQKALRDRAERIEGDLPELEPIPDLLNRLAEQEREEARSQYVARRAQYLRHSGEDEAVISRQTLSWFDERWSSLEQKLEVIPGKRVLRNLRQHLQETYSITLTDAKIVSAFHLDEVPQDLCALIERLEAFRGL